MKLRRIVSTVLILLLLMPTLPAPARAWSDSDPAIWHTTTWTENTFRYLNEMYIEKYPEMGLRWLYGTERDRQNIAKLAGIITAGCTSDTEKALAVLKWVQRNIVYDETGQNFYSYDVFYNRTGNCIGQAELIQDLLRQLGIPAVVGDGIRGDMVNRITAGKLSRITDGHAWCFAYLEGEWALLDPLWLPDACTDREFLSKWYYMDAVEGICPAYEQSNMPSLRSPGVSAFYYIDGRFMCYKGNQVNDTGTLSININLSHDYIGQMNTSIPGGSQDATCYFENPERKDQMIFGEMFRDGWTYYYDKECVGSYRFCYENGIMATGTVLTLNGERYFMDSNAAKLAIPEGAYSVAYGKLALQPGFTGKVLLPAFPNHYFTEETTEYTYNIVWTSDDPEVATVDQNGVVTNLREGTTRIRVNLIRSDGNSMSGSSISVRFYAEDQRTPDYNDYNYHTVCTYIYHETVAPTCTRIGYDDMVCCCGNTDKVNILPATGHSGAWTVIAEATATTTGLRRRICTVCGKTEEQVIPSFNSGETLPPEGTYVCDTHSFTEWKILLEPTMTEDGFRTRLCMTCGFEEGELIPRPACQHSYGPWQVVLEETHMEEGASGRECSKCGEWEYQSIPPRLNDHEWSNWEILMPPDLYNDGLKIRYCYSCGQMEEETLPAAGSSESTQPTQSVPICTTHQYGQWETVQEPTQTQSGMRIRQCQICGSKEAVILSPLGSENPKPADPSVTILTENQKMMEILSDSNIGDGVVLPVEPGITGVQMPSDLIVAMADADIKPTFAYPDASVSFDHSAIVATVPQLSSGNVTLKVKRLTVPELSPAQQAALAQQNVAAVLSMELLCGTQAIRNFAPGTVTVTLPFAPEAGSTAYNYGVFYVAEDGQLEKMPVTLSGGNLIFTTNHFSVYAVTRGASVPQPDPTEPTTEATEATDPSETAPSTETTEPSATTATIPRQPVPTTQATEQTPAATETIGSETQSSADIQSPAQAPASKLWILYLAGGLLTAAAAVVWIVKKRK